MGESLSVVEYPLAVASAVSGAASIIAAVDISAKIASLCFHYSVAVKNAKEDIKRLHIKDVLGEVKQLLDGRDKTRLSATHELLESLKASPLA
jgi:hypothetical protein